MAKTKATRKRSRESVKQMIEQALRKEFPNDTVDISDGFKDNIHVLVVSRKFDSMSEPQKQALIWEIIDQNAQLTKEEKLLVSLILPLSPAEIK